MRNSALFANTLDREIARVILEGGDPTACGCIGCRDPLPDGTCQCGKRCKCFCTLAHRAAQRAAFNDQISRVRMTLRKAVRA